MKVSIIVPIYNVMQYLEQCLDSILLTDFQDYEIICVNDGSTDKSLDILNRYHEKYREKIKIINKKNGGLSDARNVGIENAKGKYIGFVDSDDWIKRDMFKKMYEVAESGNFDIVICPYVEVYDKYNKIIMDKADKYQLLHEPPVWNKLFRRDLFNEYNIRFSKNLWYEDNEVTYKMLLVAKKVTFINEPMYYYRKNRKGSIMNSQKSNKIYDIYLIGDKLYNFHNQLEYRNCQLMQIEYLFIKNVFMRQFKKIIKYELPKLSSVKTMLKKHLNYLNEKFPNWINNKLFIEDCEGYFKNKLGKNYIRIIKIAIKIIN
ncbi:glycosyltransferase [Clostridium sp. DJ247]|uniref:glycosyltransferase family 2 protein n=1 Tax=Clostridium sp. DJ247 TaxID=2726188 RepID=UPI00162730DD|nr:glycosyltransferase [Clostridium sp. DJ247]MBC2581550.1 glycosyltransferase [Clostridium sp. DJ247]